MDTLSSQNSRRQYKVAVSCSVVFSLSGARVREGRLAGCAGCCLWRCFGRAWCVSGLACWLCVAAFARAAVVCRCARVVAVCLALPTVFACLPLCCWCTCVVPLLLAAGSASASAGSCARVREWFWRSRSLCWLRFSWFFYDI